MTQRARTRPAHIPSAEADERGLRSLVDWDALGRRGWHPDREVFAPLAEDPVFGFARCLTARCDQVAHRPGLGLCPRCRRRWLAQSPGTGFEEFCAAAPGPARPV
ncbi:MAG: hypothetical protein M3256_12165, partial [Actinomycetota bacterium]|nr:hypothetical protein [Actinomycetota bacterium]